jgi:hypothetical protein
LGRSDIQKQLFRIGRRKFLQNKGRAARGERPERARSRKIALQLRNHCYFYEPIFLPDKSMATIKNASSLNEKSESVSVLTKSLSAVRRFLLTLCEIENCMSQDYLLVANWTCSVLRDCRQISPLALHTDTERVLVLIQFCSIFCV